MFKFEGRTAVISGGAEGIGLSIAKALGEQKMNIVLADIDKKKSAQIYCRIRVIRNSCIAYLVGCG